MSRGMEREDRRETEGSEADRPRGHEQQAKGEERRISGKRKGDGMIAVEAA